MARSEAYGQTGLSLAPQRSKEFRAGTRWAFVAVLVFAAAMAVVLAAAKATAVPTVVPTGTQLEAAEVLWVPDGDTIFVRRGDGSEEYVRLIGIDCPESVNPDEEKNTDEGEAAAAFTKSLLPAGTTVWLQADTRDRDKYGRLLRYVWLEVPADPMDTEEVRTKMLNGVLLDTGHAVAKRYTPDTAYAEIFEAICG